MGVLPVGILVVLLVTTLVTGASVEDTGAVVETAAEVDEVELAVDETPVVLALEPVVSGDELDVTPPEGVEVSGVMGVLVGVRVVLPLTTLVIGSSVEDTGAVVETAAEVNGADVEIPVDDTPVVSIPVPVVSGDELDVTLPEVVEVSGVMAVLLVSEREVLPLTTLVIGSSVEDTGAVVETAAEVNGADVEIPVDDTPVVCIPVPVVSGDELDVTPPEGVEVSGFMGVLLVGVREVLPLTTLVVGSSVEDTGAVVETAAEVSGADVEIPVDDTPVVSIPVPVVIGDELDVTLPEVVEVSGVMAVLLVGEREVLPLTTLVIGSSVEDTGAVVETAAEVNGADVEIPVDDTPVVCIPVPVVSGDELDVTPPEGVEVSGFMGVLLVGVREVLPLTTLVIGSSVEDTGAVVETAAEVNGADVEIPADDTPVVSTPVPVHSEPIYNPRNLQIKQFKSRHISPRIHH
ncbi:hypothetical protein FOZ61_001911 [Perkinsus olseni]|uniref:Uncharacterized protein n=1 Tax=Perkinsus olseni TaxID=32597 RepID=A0A7J6MGH8_PEROL|nr:hypothetical protein FOZ61_001911 [Perkinsus olseni]